MPTVKAKFNTLTLEVSSPRIMQRDLKKFLDSILKFHTELGELPISGDLLQLKRDKARIIERKFNALEKTIHFNIVQE